MFQCSVLTYMSLGTVGFTSWLLNTDRQPLQLASICYSACFWYCSAWMDGVFHFHWFLVSYSFKSTNLVLKNQQWRSHLLDAFIIKLKYKYIQNLCQIIELHFMTFRVYVKTKHMVDKRFDQTLSICTMRT